MSTLYEKWRHLPVLFPGDLVFFKDKKSKVSFFIRLFSTMRGEPRTFANHVGVMYTPTLLCEAIAEGVKFKHLIRKYAKPHIEIVIYRSREVRAEERAALQEAMEHYDGKRYGKVKIVAHAVDWFLSAFTGYRKHVYLARRFCRMKKYPICSWLAVWVFKRALLPFRTSAARAQPDDLMDECEADPDWTCIFRTDGLENF